MPYNALVDKEKLERTFTDIGDAIRLKRDLANPINVEDMPLQISLIDGGGSLPVWWEGDIDVPVTMTSNGTIATITDPQFSAVSSTQFFLMLAEPADKNFDNNEVQWSVCFTSHANSATITASASSTSYYKRGLSGAMGSYGIYISSHSRPNSTITISAAASTTRIIKSGKWHITIYDLLTLPTIY